MHLNSFPVKLASVLFVAPFLLFIYVHYFDLVGNFPAETVHPQYVATDSQLLDTLCLRSVDAHTAAETVLPLAQPLTDPEVAQLDDFPSLYYSALRAQIRAIDQVTPQEQRFLQGLMDQHKLQSGAYAGFLAAAQQRYPDCAGPRLPLMALHEAYWAAKSTAVAHHWAHLYEGGVFDQRAGHAQYGYAVPLLAKWITVLQGQQGPKHFIQVAWVVFALIGLVYMACYVWLLGAYPLVATVLLLYKVLLFSKLGADAILLAPGYHWSRELVLIVVPTLASLALLCRARTGAFGNVPAQLAYLGAALLLFLLDPAFLLVALACLLGAFGLTHLRALYHRLVATRRRILVVSAGILGVFTGLAYQQFSNLSYVLNKLVSGDYLLFAFDAKRYYEVLCISLFAVLVLVWTINVARRWMVAYFALIALASSTYYYITPDKFHYYKYLEYLLPLVVLVAGGVGKYAAERLAQRQWARALPLRRAATGLALLVLVFSAYRLVLSLTAANDVRLQDGRYYFNFRPAVVNGREMSGNYSDVMLDHLRSFPKNVDFDYLISPFDKYIIFLYDMHNGFGAPDMVSSLDSTHRLQAFDDMVLSKDEDKTILLDTTIFDLDARYGIHSGNHDLGKVAYASKLNVKSRLRAQDLANYVQQHCSAAGPAHGAWRVYRCRG